MKINSITAKNLYQINFNKTQTEVFFNKKIAKDCFVKSNAVSFSGNDKKMKRSQTLELFMKDLGKKLNCANFSVNDVSSSMRKYDKNVSVKSINHAPKELLFSKSLQGLYCSDLVYDEINNNFVIPEKNRIFYMKTETLKENLGRESVFVNAVHEFSHVLQSEDDDINQIGLFNKYLLNKKDDADGAVNQVCIASSLTAPLEEYLARPFIDVLYQNEDFAYTRMQNGRTDFVGWLSRKNRITDFDLYVKEKVNEKLDLAQSENNTELDKDLVLDTLLTHFEREIEAYENENKAFKMCLGMDSPRALTRVQLYKKFIDVLIGMKNK